MSENESRPLERWSTSLAPIHLEHAERWLDARVSDTGNVSVFINHGEYVELVKKAAALDKILAAWGMTWDEYKQKGSPCLDG